MVAPSTTEPGVGTGARSADGSQGQRLTVTPADDLPVEGATVRAVGSGFDPAVGIYVALCVDQGAGVAPSPCVGGVDMAGAGSSSAWVSSNPPDYAGDLSSRFGPGGSFDVTLTIDAADEFVDCLAEGTRCVVATRADHTAGSNRSADLRVPVTFRGQTQMAPEPGVPAPTVSLGSGTVAAGSTVNVSGQGFLAGEQVQVWLFSEPTLLTVETADTGGAVGSTVTIPVTITAGTHHIELRGLTSGRTVRSAELTVTTSNATGSAGSAGSDRTAYSAAPAGGASATPRSLALTGNDMALWPALSMIALGAVLLVGTRRHAQSTRSNQHRGASR